MDNTPYLSIKNLSKIYNEVPVLNKLNLDVFKNERLAIIGLSGSGKSTLLRMIYGLLDNDGGEIRLENDRVKGRSEVLVPGDDRIKYVRQNYELFPDHTVFENIEHAIRFHKKEYIEKRIKKLLKAFDIEKIRGVKTKLVSGGEQQRVAICCALAESPSLLLLDEPMAHLDPINAWQIKSYLWNFIEKEQITTIFVTHSSEDALAYSTRVAVVHNGKIIESNTPDALYKKPKKLVSGQLLGVLGKVSSDLLPEEFKTRKSFRFRPESICISNDNNGIEFEIIESRFLGKNYIISAKNNENLVHFYHEEALNKGEKVALNFKLDEIIQL